MDSKMSESMKASDGTEKVKRRMIRTIGRLLQDRKPQDEIWEYMQKEYGTKCKILWDRMRLLTLKKLKCLFNALDVVNNVPKMARMTLTDWLIFDLVLVHEKFDVIDMKSIREHRPSKVLQNLFSLVLRFEIEGRSGEDLADAWIAATVYYNSLGHQCSPMLLQRRWFQLKELTRATFYKFWFIFRGNKRQLDRAKEDSPITELQRDIALRYSHLVTQPFVEWQDCINNRTIIMPEQFDTKMRNVNLMKPSDLSIPDLVLIEPKINTIDLCDDSDIEEVNEVTNKKTATEKDTGKIKAIELSPVMIKNEPIDLDDELPEDMQNLDTQVEENNDFDEEIQRLQLVENEIVIDTDGEGPTEDRESENNSPDGNEENTRKSTDGNEEIRCENKTQATTEGNIVDTLINAAIESQHSNVMEVENPDLNHFEDVNQEQFSEINNDNVNTNESDETEANLMIKSENIQEINSDSYVESVDQNNETVDQPDLVVKVENDTLINEANAEGTLPVISTISSAGVPVSMDTAIERHSNNATPMDTDDFTENVLENTQIEEDNFRENYVIGQSEDLKADNLMDNLTQTEDKEGSSSEEDIIKLPPPVVDKVAFNDIIPHDLEFADEGIQLADDGIDYVEDDEDDNVETEDEQPKIDQKLLMVPVIYTTKLDNMIVFKQRLLLDGVNQKEILEKILAESKPISKLTINVEPEDISKIKKLEQCDEKLKQPLMDANILNQPLMNENIINPPLMDVNALEKPVMASSDELIIKEEPHDLEENSAFDSSEEEVEVPRIKPTSYLLRKPRRRSYNPIQLCKNPDFNTRLKRLPVSFFTSQRNRLLLSECKPMTIDVCKAFENKLYNGTLYLTNCGQSNFTSPVKVNSADAMPTVSAITPSANPVQSLMDIDKLLEDELKKRMGERNKTINLPDITEVRRINQHILTAEVTPLRVTPTNSPINEDVSIVIEDDQAVSSQGVIEKVANEEEVVLVAPTKPTITPTQQKNFAHPKPEASTNPEIPDSNNPQNHMSLNKIRKQNRKTIYPQLNWRSTRNIRTPIDNSDLLLTTDTLYKMLFAIDPRGVKSSSYNKYVRDNIKTKVVLQKKTIFYPKGQSHKKKEDEPIEIAEDANKKPEDKNQEKQPEIAKAIVKVVYDRPKFVKRKRYCCWANARIDLLNGNTVRSRLHKCREICSCCCKHKLADMIFTKESKHDTPKALEANEDDIIKNACESIESVVQQTRELSQSKPIYVPAAAKIKTTYLDVIRPTTGTQVDLVENDDSPTKNTDDVVHKRILASNVQPRRLSLLEKLAEAQANILKGPPTISKPIKKLSHAGKTQWTLCPCKRPVLKLTDQRMIVVDGTNTCQYHSNKKKSKQGQLYINRKAHSESPIFIGKNKLLLTTVKKPNLKLAAPPVTPSVAPVPTAEKLQMPEGVQIVLLPNGTLTYSVDSGAKVTAEQLSVMPAIIAAVQGHFTSGNVATIDPKAGGQQEQIKESYDIIGFKEGKEYAVPVETVPLPTVGKTPSMPVEIINLDDVLPINTVLPINAEDIPKTVDTVTPIEPNNTDNTLLSPNKKTNAPKAVPISNKTNETFTEVEKANDNEENNLVIDENINKDISTNQETKTMATGSTQTSETNEIESATQKNRASLLSDLMEMSGICEEDIAPAAVPVSQDVALSVGVPDSTPQGSLTQRTQPILIPPPSLSPLSPFSKKPQSSDTKDVYANLCTVNNFHDLKYSYNHNGLFFKLDLDSGIIVPITICIKKKQMAALSSKPGAVIDLTDDDDDEKITFESAEKSPTASDNILSSSVFNRVLSEVMTANKSLNLKRIKPNILQRVHKLTPNQRSLLKICPKPRKIYPKKVQAQIDLVDSDNPMEEEYLQSCSNDDTSDDEPLAKKAKRAAEQRRNLTPVDFEAQIDSMTVKKNLDTVQAMQADDSLDLELPQHGKGTHSSTIMVPGSILDAPILYPSAVTLDDPKPNHLVLTGYNHHETVPIDSYYNDEGDDEDSQDCILGV